MTIERKSIGRLLVAAIAVMVVAALGVSVALATHIPPISTSAHMSGCSVKWEMTLDPNTSWNVYLYELEPNGSLGKLLGSDGDSSGQSEVSGSFWVGYADTDRVALYSYDGLIAKLSLDTCTTGEPQTWWFSVAGLPGTSPEASYPNAAGNTACALFDVQGWGAKTVDLADYPNCSGEVTVMCLDGEGNWTDSTIHNLAQDGTVVTFLSGQHGTCGFFEQ